MTFILYTNWNLPIRQIEMKKAANNKCVIWFLTLLILKIISQYYWKLLIHIYFFYFSDCMVWPMGKAVSFLFIADLPYTYTSLMSREVGGVCRVRKNLPPWYSSFSAFLLPAFHFYNNQITLENYMNIKSTHPHVFRSKI